MDKKYIISIIIVLASCICGFLIYAKIDYNKIQIRGLLNMAIEVDDSLYDHVINTNQGIFYTDTTLKTENPIKKGKDYVKYRKVVEQQIPVVKTTIDAEGNVKTETTLEWTIVDDDTDVVDTIILHGKKYPSKKFHIPMNYIDETYTGPTTRETTYGYETNQKVAYVASAEDDDLKNFTGKGRINLYTGDRQHMMDKLYKKNKSKPILFACIYISIIAAIVGGVLYYYR